jgi:hypothetical protein
MNDSRIAKWVFNLGKSRAYFWGFIEVLPGLIAFVIDFFLAIYVMSSIDSFFQLVT